MRSGFYMKKQALISCSDKSGVVEFAKELSNLGYHILSTGGTAKLIAEAGIPVQEVADYTGFPLAAAFLNICRLLNSSRLTRLISLP